MKVDTSMCKHIILFTDIIPGSNQHLSCSFGVHKKHRFTLKAAKQMHTQLNPKQYILQDFPQFLEGTMVQ